MFLKCSISIAIVVAIILFIIIIKCYGDHDDKYTLMHKVELSFCEMPITSIITKHVHIKSDIEEHIA